jgi:hypothetical protein
MDICFAPTESERQNHITKYNTKYIGYGELIEMLSIFFGEGCVSWVVFSAL